MRFLLILAILGPSISWADVDQCEHEIKARGVNQATAEAFCQRIAQGNMEMVNMAINCMNRMPVNMKIACLGVSVRASSSRETQGGEHQGMSYQQTSRRGGSVQ